MSQKIVFGSAPQYLNGEGWGELEQLWLCCTHRSILARRKPASLPLKINLIDQENMEQKECIFCLNESLHMTEWERLTVKLRIIVLSNTHTRAHTPAHANTHKHTLSGWWEAAVFLLPCGQCTTSLRLGKSFSAEVPHKVTHAPKKARPLNFSTFFTLMVCLKVHRKWQRFSGTQCWCHGK